MRVTEFFKRIQTTRWRSKARGVLRGIGLDVAHPRSDHSSISAIRELLSTSGKSERYTAERLLRGSIAFAKSGIIPRGQLIQDALAVGGFANGGFFVEVGSADPFELSNTATLIESFNWRGLRVEPNPKYAEQHEKYSHPNVEFVRALIGEDDRSYANLVLAGELSTRETYIDSDSHAASRRAQLANQGVARVVVRRLDTLLDEFEVPDRVDFLSVDTEGSEFEVLSTFPWGRRSVGLAAVEHNFDRQRLAQIDELMRDNGLTRVLKAYSAWDAWYVNVDLYS